MLKTWLNWINYGLVGGAALFLFSALFLSFTHAEEIVLPDPTLTKRTLPTNPFAQPKPSCDAISKTFDLKYSPMTLQLPDLRSHLVYYGKNGRPDAQPEKTVLHFGFLNNPNTSTVLASDRLYLVYDNKKPTGTCQYCFSPNNAETPIWIEPSASGTEASVLLRMKNENGEIIREPTAHAQFSLQEKEIMKSGNKVWEIGKWRVDGSLLARQKARWMGPDLFIEKHGGEEYKAMLGKHRIDFTDEEESYSVYVSLNDSLIWDDNRWKTVQPGADSREYALIVVKKVDERLINFELWDVGGKNKISLNLLKSMEPWAPQNVQNDFKFMGARTRSQYIFEINDQRTYLSPQDWLLQTTDDGWIKLNTVELIDNFVDRKITGVLFVFDGVEKRDEGQVLVATIFNPSRTDMQTIEIPIKQTSSRGDKSAQKGDGNDDDEDSDEDYDDDEDVPPRGPPPPPHNARPPSAIVAEKEKPPTKR